MTPVAAPRLPVLGWATFRGSRDAGVPSILDASKLVYTTSGSAAIRLALHLLEVTAGEKVLVPTYHCPTMIAPVAAAHAQPVFYPLDAAGCPSMEYLAAIEMRGVRAILAAHYFGIPRPMARLRRFCDGAGIALIEDCAHALFGTIEGRSVGSWGDFAICSLPKFFPVPEGGCLISNVSVLHESVRPPRPLSGEVKAGLDALEMGARYNRFPGVNSLLRAAFGIKNTLRDWHARVGGRKEEFGERSGDGTELAPEPDLGHPARATVWIARHATRRRIFSNRRRNYDRLTELLSNKSGVRPLNPTLPETSAPYVFPLWVEGPESVYGALRASCVPVFRWDDVWPGTPSLTGDFGLLWAHHVFQLGCHQDLSLDDMTWIAEEIGRLVGS